MFGREKFFIRSSNVSASLFVEGDDVQNSEFYYLLDNCIDRKTYLVTKYEHRLDLISIDIYGSNEYAWVIQYLNRITNDDILKGVTLEYIPIETLNTLISTV